MAQKALELTLLMLLPQLLMKWQQLLGFHCVAAAAGCDGQAGDLAESEESLATSLSSS